MHIHSADPFSLSCLAAATLRAACCSMTKQQIAAVDAAASLGLIGPADGAAIAAEQRALLQRHEIDFAAALSANGETNSASSGQ